MEEEVPVVPIPSSSAPSFGTISAGARPKPPSSMKKVRKGKRRRDAGADDNGRFSKKTKIFDNTGSKLISKVETTFASSSMHNTLETQQKRKIQADIQKADTATASSSSSATAKLFKCQPDDKSTGKWTPSESTSDSSEEQTDLSESQKKKLINPPVTIEDIGSEEVILSSRTKYRDPLVDDGSELSDDNDNESRDGEDEDSNSEGNWRNDYPDDDFERGDDDPECTTSTDGNSSSDSEDEASDLESDEFKGNDASTSTTTRRKNNKKITDKDIADCSSKLGKLLEKFHKENGPIQVNSHRSAKASYVEDWLTESEDEDYFDGTARGHHHHRRLTFLDGGLADEIVSSPSDSD